MEFVKRIIEGEFIYRQNRFIAYVKLDQESVIVHVPNTGRCREILLPGARVLLREENGENRKTKYDLIAVYKKNLLINIDSQLPNDIVEEALVEKRIRELSDYTQIEREKTFKNSRFDFKLKDQYDEYYLEIKGVTLEVEGKAMFPDAPTLRGRRHMLELVEAKKSGFGAGVLFLIQMDGINSFAPNDLMDKSFGDALRYAGDNGVDIFAYNCSVGQKFITLSKRIKVEL